jgi:excisionase family DNA binding protein
MTQHVLLASLEVLIQDADQADCARVIGILEQAKALALGKFLSVPAPVRRESETLLTVPEVAKQLNLSTYTTYELCRSGKLQAHKCGKKSVRVAPSAVAVYLAEQHP